MRSGLAARWRGALLAGVAALALAACNGGSGPGPGAKAMKPLSPEMVSLIESKGMTKDSPIVVRIFKEESELEVWKETRNGEYALLKTYPICRWSGELGPKVKEGDRQAPEGFYTITPGQMNPNSNYYLAFNMGFPNAYDKAWGRTGANLMVHGDCSSSGCYAMTDEQVQEIFALGRDSFLGGQRSFQVQAYPFHMTASNMARHRNNPSMPFWRMIKEGHDAFEIAKAPPKVDVCEKRYVFNATPTDPTQKFNPSGPCPEFTQPEDIQQQVAARKAADTARIAALSPMTPVAPVRTGKDGGMNQVFLAKLQNPKLKAPGSLPPVVKPPGLDYGVATNEPAPAELLAPDSATPSATESVALASANVPMPMPRPAGAPRAQPETVLFANNSAPAAPATRVASIDSGGFLSGVTKFFGGGDEPAAAPAPSATAPSSAPVASSAAPAPSASPSLSSRLGLSSLGKWFGQGEPEPAAPVAMATPAAVPVPPTRPAAPKPQATAPAATPRAAAAQPASQPAASQSVAPAPQAAAAQASDAQWIETPSLPGATIVTPGTFGQ
ncbi:L,D-transpeptidase family protein [Bosea sp. 117]|uniref:L,D-transpeptidase family protein n=1 Tax=Bosea sp. 117 TaxID=1125973 RepID=UPI000689F06D|nr:L,D-transpeptidase family protein [Bosea sp. 117]